MHNKGQWQVAGSAPEVYEQELVPTIFGPWAPIVIDLAHPRPGDRVLDVACGTGIVMRAVAERVGPTGVVVGVDLNPGMLDVARTAWSKDVPSGVHVQWHEASADKLPFSNGSFNVTLCQLGLQFFTDRVGALREMHRVLVAAGRLALMVWCGIGESPAFAALADALERRAGEATARIARAPFVLAEVDELNALVRAAGFQDVAIRKQVGTVCFPSVDRFVASYIAGSPLAGPMSQADGLAHQALIKDVRNALHGHATDTVFVCPMAAHLVSARA